MCWLQLGLKASALAWLWAAQALQNHKPGQKPKGQLGPAWLWPRPGPITHIWVISPTYDTKHWRPPTYSQWLQDNLEHTHTSCCIAMSPPIYIAPNDAKRGLRRTAFWYVFSFSFLLYQHLYRLCVCPTPTTSMCRHVTTSTTSTTC
jgi:hypothetical protein